MDSRRFDRNADQLCQIYWHFANMKIYQPDNAVEKRRLLLEMLQECIHLNDDLGKMTEQGLI